ncbi:hypothetical protein [Actinomyces provencensis]|uniref:hypothetical protein n=1 Tax=Actinomyces provencensis TaxID=1720198 RepID=UPI00096A578E|nr:hypothetical protein [Actinomyces provencensis]
MPRPSVLLRLGAASGLVVLASGCASSSTTTSLEGTGATTQDPTTSSTGASGSYSATGSYSSPGGQQSIEVELTLEDGTVTAVTVTPGASDSQALRYQQDFAEHVSAEVVGKTLEEADVTTVASSSLTGAGFNSALEEIREQAGE